MESLKLVTVSLAMLFPSQQPNRSYHRANVIIKQWCRMSYVIILFV